MISDTKMHFLYKTCKTELAPFNGLGTAAAAAQYVKQSCLPVPVSGT